MAQNRKILPIALLLSMTSLSGGEPINLWILQVIDYRFLPGDSTFRISTRSDAFIEHSGCCSMLGGAAPQDDPFAAALAYDLTNGLSNPITIASPYFTYSIDEDFLLGKNNDVERNIENWTRLNSASTNGIDLEGWRITGFGMSITTTTNGIWGYSVAGWGVPIPEPSFGAMLLGIILPLGVQRLGRRKRDAKQGRKSYRSRRACGCEWSFLFLPWHKD